MEIQSPHPGGLRTISLPFKQVFVSKSTSHTPVYLTVSRIKFVRLQDELKAWNVLEDDLHGVTTAAAVVGALAAIRAQSLFVLGGLALHGPRAPGVRLPLRQEHVQDGVEGGGLGSGARDQSNPSVAALLADHLQA